MNKISMDKKYKTANGLPARVICIDRNHKSFPVIALVTIPTQGGTVESHSVYTAYGKYWYDGPADENDLVEITEFDEFKIDDPVMVRYDENSPWVRRYFAGVDEHGKAQTWIDGMTSWTAMGDSEDLRKTTWDHCRRPLHEEMQNLI